MRGRSAAVCSRVRPPTAGMRCRDVAALLLDPAAVLLLLVQRPLVAGHLMRATSKQSAKSGNDLIGISDDLYERGGVRSKLPDGSGPDRTPIPPITHGRDRTSPPSQTGGRETHRRWWLFHAGISAGIEL